MSRKGQRAFARRIEAQVRGGRRRRKKRVSSQGKLTSTQAPAPKPWLAVVLGIDTATMSGWSVRVSGKQCEFGECDTTDADSVAEIVQWAAKRAAHVQLPLVMVLERPWGGTMATVEGLARARERWMRAWQECGQSPGRVVRVHVSTWRAALLGPHWVSAPRDDVRAYEQSVATIMVGQQVGEDEAPAILISHWGSMAAAVGKAIGKRAMAASQLAWRKAS